MSNLQQRRPQQPSSDPSTLQEKTLQQNLGPSDTSPLVTASVIQTLLGFTAAMVILPIGSYFVTVNTIFRGNSTFAGGLAALVANVVLIGYVIVAWKDDQEDQRERKGVVGTGVRGVEGRKDQ